MDLMNVPACQVPREILFHYTVIIGALSHYLTTFPDAVNITPGINVVQFAKKRLNCESMCQ